MFQLGFRSPWLPLALAACALQAACVPVAPEDRPKRRPGMSRPAPFSSPLPSPAAQEPGATPVAPGHSPAGEAPGASLQAAPSPATLPARGQGPQGRWPAGVEGLGQARPNELGMVPVLRYRGVGRLPGERSPAQFLADLAFLARQGYALVPASALAEARVHLPQGRKALVLSLEGPLKGLVRLVQDREGRPVKGPQGRLKLAPDCAVGLLLEANAAHPGLGVAATLHLNQAVTLGDREALQELQARGLDLGVALPGSWSRARPAQLEAALSTATAALVRAGGPGLLPKSLAIELPPRSPAALAKLRQGGHVSGSYRFSGLLTLGLGPAPSPHALRFAPMAIPAMPATDATFRRWFGRLGTSVGPEAFPAYASDGDPKALSAPAGLAAKVRPASLAPGLRWRGL